MISILKRYWPFKKNKWPHLTLDEILKRSRILVIDDSEFVYLKLFKKDGYNIEKWNDINNLQKLEQGFFDIVLLDIHGVGREQSQEEGFGILKHLQQVSPAQIVIAYSEADYSLKFHEFFQRADAVLAKSSDYVEFKRTVDTLLSKRFSLGFYLDRIVNISRPYVTDPEKVKELATNAIFGHDDPNKLEFYLRDHIDNKKNIALILQIVQVAIGIAALCK